MSRTCRFRRPALWALLTLLAALTCRPAAAAAAYGTLDIYWIDSEGGGSTLLVTPAGESVLIDTGNPGGRDAARIHKVATEVARLERIDHLIVTHFHIDHFGGAAELATLLPIRHVWDNGLPDGDPDGRRPSTWPLTSKPYREMRVEARHVVQPGTVLPLRSGKVPLDLRCVVTRQQTWTPPDGGRAPAADAQPPSSKARDTSDNANSSAWVLTFGPFRFFDGGDLTWNTEATLVWPRILVPEVDLLQVTHHGLDVSNHPRLLQALNPTVTVMNNGPTKGTMAEVMQSLRGLPALKAQFQVHKNVRPDGATNNCPDAFIANLDRECEGRFIRCTVDPDGTRFNLTLPPGDARHTYVSRGLPGQSP